MDIQSSITVKLENAELNLFDVSPDGQCSLQLPRYRRGVQTGVRLRDIQPGGLPRPIKMEAAGDFLRCSSLFTQHIQSILHLKWSNKNDLLSCSGDNNGYVISLDASSKKWKSSLINISGHSLRALCAGDWNKAGDRFAIAGGRGDVYIGYYSTENNQWDTVPITRRLR